MDRSVLVKLEDAGDKNLETKDWRVQGLNSARSWRRLLEADEGLFIPPTTPVNSSAYSRMARCCFRRMDIKIIQSWSVVQNPSNRGALQPIISKACLASTLLGCS